MSFKNLNKEKLLQAAEFVNLDVTEDNTKAEIITAIEESGFTWSNYQKFIAADNRVPGEALNQGPHHEAPRQGTADQPFATPSAQAATQFNQMVLLKMERQNGTFEILGNRFTKTQPFQVMSADEAQEIIDAAEKMGGGFRIATPAEAKSYFG
jgi:hypothetical protein